MGGACCSAEAGDQADACAALQREIGDPNEAVAPTFQWRFRDSYANIPLGLSGGEAVAKGLHVRASRRGGPIKLELQSLQLGDAGVTALGPGFACDTEIHELNLVMNGVQATGVWSLAKALRPQVCLSKLSLSRNEVEPQALGGLCDALQSSASATLSSLDIPLGNASKGAALAVEDAPIPALRRLLGGLPALRSLSLHVWGAGVGDPAMTRVFLDAVRGPNSIDTLRIFGLPDRFISGIDVADGDAQGLAGAVARLRVVDFHHIRVGRQCVTALCQAFGGADSNIGELTVFNAALGPQDAEPISAALVSTRSLKTLDLGSNPRLEGEPLKRLIGALRLNRTLRTVNLTHLAISREVAEVLITALERPTAAPITILRHRALDDDRLATRLDAVLRRNEVRVEGETSSASSSDEDHNPGGGIGSNRQLPPSGLMAVDRPSDLAVSSLPRHDEEPPMVQLEVAEPSEAHVQMSPDPKENDDQLPPLRSSGQQGDLLIASTGMVELSPLRDEDLEGPSAFSPKEEEPEGTPGLSCTTDPPALAPVEGQSPTEAENPDPPPAGPQQDRGTLAADVPAEAADIPIVVEEGAVAHAPTTEGTSTPSPTPEHDAHGSAADLDATIRVDSVGGSEREGTPEIQDDTERLDSVIAPPGSTDAALATPALMLPPARDDVTDDELFELVID